MVLKVNDKVVCDSKAEYGASGTFKAELMGMKPTGKSFKVKDVDIYTFNDDGKITEHRSVQSMATMLSQVGAKMK